MGKSYDSFQKNTTIIFNFKKQDKPFYTLIMDLVNFKRSLIVNQTRQNRTSFD